MKRRNLFLSLISSVLVAVAIITVTIVSVVKPKNNNTNNNGGVNTPAGNINITDDDKKSEYDTENAFNRDGSKEKPYIVYSAESFNNLVGEYGSKKREVEDGEGNKTYDVYNFELVADIDFAGIDYKPLFNDGTSFIGSINGNGYAIKNIAINVTVDNISEYYFKNASNNRYYSYIALFGKMEKATLENIAVTGLKVNVASEVYDYVSNAQLYTEKGVSLAQILVGGIAGEMKFSKLSNVTLDGEVAGFGYAIRNSSNTLLEDNAFGGVCAVAENVTIEDSDINVDVNTNSGKEYLVGGIAGYGRVATITNTKVNATVHSTYSRNLDIAGLFCYGKTLNVKDVEINFNLFETASEEERNAYVEAVKAGTHTTLSYSAGVVVYLRANDATTKSVIDNVKVNAVVDFDCRFAGVVMNVKSTNEEDLTLVTLNDVVVSMDVNTLTVSAIAIKLVATTVTYSEEAKAQEGYCNVEIKGNVKLEGSDKYVAVSVFASNNPANGKYVSRKLADLHVKISSDLDKVFSKALVNTLIKGNLASYSVI